MNPTAEASSSCTAASLAVCASAMTSNRMDHNTINARDPNLTKFLAHGGKLLMYHGWSDVLLAPRNTVNYYATSWRESGSRATRYDCT